MWPSLFGQKFGQPCSSRHQSHKDRFYLARHKQKVARFLAQILPYFKDQILPDFKDLILSDFKDLILPDFKDQILPDFRAQILPDFYAQMLFPRFHFCVTKVNTLRTMHLGKLKRIFCSSLTRF